MGLAAEKIDYISVEDYLEGEKYSEIRYEYVDGQVYAMAGAKINHSRIVRNVTSLLWQTLKDQPCEPLSTDMLVKTTETRYRYPDILVVCDDDPSDDPLVRENPVLIIEVLSKSTRKKDKGEKRLEYLSIPSVQEYVLIEQDFSEVEVQRRRENWRSSYYFLGDEVVLESVDVRIPVEDMYVRVDNEDLKAYLEEKARAAAEANTSTDED